MNPLKSAESPNAGGNTRVVISTKKLYDVTSSPGACIGDDDGNAEGLFRQKPELTHLECLVVALGVAEAGTEVKLGLVGNGGTLDFPVFGRLVVVWSSAIGVAGIGDGETPGGIYSSGKNSGQGGGATVARVKADHHTGNIVRKAGNYPEAPLDQNKDNLFPGALHRLGQGYLLFGEV